MPDFIIYDLSVKDRFSNNNVMAAGGQAIVCLTGVYTLATLYDPDNNMQALSQPVSMTRGRIRFAVSSGVAGQTQPPAVDVYGIDPTGRGFQLYNVTPGAPSIVRLDYGRTDTQIVLPFSYAQGTVASPVDLGINLVQGMVIDPFPWIDVKTLDSGITLDVGLLASESGGDADGFLAAISCAAAGVVRGKLAATATVGALLLESQNTGAVNTGRPYIVGATAVSLIWTLSSGADTAKGRIVLPARVGVTG